MHKKLAHLTEEQVNTLIERYYKGEKIERLITEFKIDVHTGGLVCLFPLFVNDKLLCPYCEGKSMVAKCISRYYVLHGANAQVPELNWYCPKCKHIEKDIHCQCKNCLVIREQQILEREKPKRQILEKTLNLQNTDCPATKYLTLREILFLLSLESHSLSEDLHYIEPCLEINSKLTPTSQFTKGMVKDLYAKGFVAISLQSKLDAFEFSEDGTNIESYDFTKVLWEFLPGKDIESKRIYIKELKNLLTQEEKPSSWNNEIPLIWRDIAKHECIENFVHLLHQRDFHIGIIGEKTHIIFEALLEEFSVSQVFYLTWLAIRDTLDYIVAEGIPYSRGKNIFIGSIQRKAERYKAEKWPIKHSTRSAECRQTVISSIFFHSIVKLGEEAIKVIPPKINPNVVSLYG